MANVNGISSAVFYDGKGMGMFEDFWGGAVSKRAVEEEVNDSCEVWFSRVSDL